MGKKAREAFVGVHGIKVKDTIIISMDQKNNKIDDKQLASMVNEAVPAVTSLAEAMTYNGKNAQILSSVELGRNREATICSYFATEMTDDLLNEIQANRMMPEQYMVTNMLRDMIETLDTDKKVDVGMEAIDKYSKLGAWTSILAGVIAPPLVHMLPSIILQEGASNMLEGLLTTAPRLSDTDIRAAYGIAYFEKEEDRSPVYYIFNITYHLGMHFLKMGDMMSALTIAAALAGINKREVVVMPSLFDMLKKDEKLEDMVNKIIVPVINAARKLGVTELKYTKLDIRNTIAILKGAADNLNIDAFDYHIEFFKESDIEIIEVDADSLEDTIVDIANKRTSDILVNIV